MSAILLDIKDAAISMEKGIFRGIYETEGELAHEKFPGLRDLPLPLPPNRL